MVTTTTSTTKPTTSRAILLVLAALAASAVATSLVALVASAFGVGSGFPPLQPPAFLTFATVGTLAAIGGWLLIVRLVPASARVLRILVPTLVVLSLIPDVVMLITPFIEVATPGAVIALMLMHPIVATVAVIAAQRIAPAR